MSGALRTAPRPRLPSVPYASRLQAGADLIEQNVYYDARNADVQPDRKGPARDGAMSIESGFECPVQSNDGEDRNCGGEDRMREKDGEVDGSHPPRLVEAYGPDIVVIDKIADQKRTQKA